MNECETGSTFFIFLDNESLVGACETGFTCWNTHGSYNCEDMNECENEEHTCDDLISNCTNLAGSYKCQCVSGFEGNSQIWKFSEIIESSHRNYLKEKNQECKDIDECLISTHDCQDNATCVNSYGSFTCACNVGYMPWQEGHEVQSGKRFFGVSLNVLFQKVALILMSAWMLQTRALQVSNLRLAWT